MGCTEKIRENGKITERPCGKSATPPTPALIRDTGDVPFLQKVKNFAAATVQHVAAGMPMASDEEILRRHDICQACEYFKNNACSKCGCPVYRDKKFVSKLAWADQSCPIGKWGPTQ